MGCNQMMATHVGSAARVDWPDKFNRVVISSRDGGDDGTDASKTHMA